MGCPHLSGFFRKTAYFFIAKDILPDEKMAEDTQPKIPNKYQSSYILWLSRNRKEYLENNKQMQLIDATRALAKEWSGLDDEEKEVYISMPPDCVF